MARASVFFLLVAATSLGCGGAASTSSAAPPANVAPCSVATIAPRPAAAAELPPTRLGADAALDGCGATVDLEWLSQAEVLRISSSGHGHFGHAETHVDLERVYGEEVFRGVIVGTQRSWHAPEPAYEAKQVEVSSQEVHVLLAALRDGARLEREPDGEAVFVTDSSRSEVITVEVSKRKEAAPGQWRAPHEVAFVVDEGETSPLPWRLRSCGKRFVRPAREASSAAYRTFLDRVGVSPLIQRVKTRASQQPRPSRPAPTTPKKKGAGAGF